MTGPWQSGLCSSLGRTAGDIGDVGPMSSVFVLLLFIYLVVIMEGKASTSDCIIFINRIKLQKVLDLL